MKLLSNIKNTSFNFLNRKKLASKDTTTKASRQSKHELDVKELADAAEALDYY